MSWLFFPALLMRSGPSQKPPAGSADYEGSRCSGEIRIKCAFDSEMGVPVFIFYLAFHLSVSEC